MNNILTYFMKTKSIGLAKLTNKTVLTRVDFNVPLAGKKIKDDFKIRASLDLIKFLIEKEAKVLLVSHLGEPSAKAGDRTRLSLNPVAKRLGKLLKKRLVFLNQRVGGEALKQAVARLRPGQVALLENIRFCPGETKNDSKLARQLAELADIYVNNAFAVSHRAHASVAAIKKYLPSFAGPLLVAEVTHLKRVLKPKQPLIVIMGGVKVSTKVALLKKLAKKANHVLLGGALANNFLAAAGWRLGRSAVSRSEVALAKTISWKNLVFPLDVVVKTRDGQTAWRHLTKIKTTDMIVDIGPETMKMFGNYIKRASTLLWNGPMGVYEQPTSRYGTLFIARAVASRSSGRAFGVVGGGETVDALNLTKMADEVDWVSTGGAAALSYLSGEKLPGLRGLIV